MWRERHRSSVLLPVLMMMALTLFLVPPGGDFPLNDDWAYAENVRSLVEEHRLASANRTLALLHTAWGALFTLPLGFSYTALRLSTLALALLALWLTARCALQVGLGQREALLCAAVLLVNPAFLNLSYTFMTDVSFTAVLLLGGFFYLRSFETDSAADLLLGSLFAAAATSTRQFGIMLPAAFILADLPLRLADRRRCRTSQAVGFLLPWAAALLLLPAIPGPENHAPQFTVSLGTSLAASLARSVEDEGIRLCYLGLFLLPLAAQKLFHLAIRRKLWSAGQWMAFPGVIALVFLGISRIRGEWVFGIHPLPLLGNILYDLGTGPLTLRDTYLARLPGPVAVGGWWWPATIAAMVSAAVLCVDVIPPLWRGWSQRPAASKRESLPGKGQPYFAKKLFLLLWGGFFLAAPYPLFAGETFDRYLLPALPPLIILAAVGLRSGGKSRGGAWAAVAIFYLFSLACVQDYLSWNSARWEAVNYLIRDRKVPPEKIDAGYEFNALYTRAEFKKRSGLKEFTFFKGKGMWVLDDTYAVSFNPRPGMREMTRIPYHSWLGMEERFLLVLERPPP